MEFTLDEQQKALQETAKKLVALINSKGIN